MYTVYVWYDKDLLTFRPVLPQPHVAQSWCWWRWVANEDEKNGNQLNSFLNYRSFINFLFDDAALWPLNFIRATSDDRDLCHWQFSHIFFITDNYGGSWRSESEILFVRKLFVMEMALLRWRDKYNVAVLLCAPEPRTHTHTVQDWSNMRWNRWKFDRYDHPAFSVIAYHLSLS